MEYLVAVPKQDSAKCQVPKGTEFGAMNLPFPFANEQRLADFPCPIRFVVDTRPTKQTVRCIGAEEKDGPPKKLALREERQQQMLRNLAIIEDQPEIQKDFRQQAEGHGWRVHQAFSVADAMRIVESVRLDGALIDLSLLGPADRSGQQAYEAILKDPTTACALVSSLDSFKSWRKFSETVDNNDRTKKKEEVRENASFLALLEWMAMESKKRRVDENALHPQRLATQLHQVIGNREEIASICSAMNAGSPHFFKKALEEAIDEFGPFLKRLEDTEPMKNPDGTFSVLAWSLGLAAEVEIGIVPNSFEFKSPRYRKKLFSTYDRLHDRVLPHSFLAVNANNRFAAPDTPYQAPAQARSKYKHREFGESKFQQSDDLEHES